MSVELRAVLWRGDIFVLDSLPCDSCEVFRTSRRAIGQLFIVWDTEFASGGGGGGGGGDGWGREGLIREVNDRGHGGSTDENKISLFALEG